MRAFLEKVEGDYLDDFVFISKYQLQNLGVEIIDFDGSNLKSLDKYDFNIKNDIIIGSVEASCVFFKKCEIETPKYLGYPEELKKYLDRKIIETKFGEINHPYPYFIKPSNHVKLFTGTLVKSEKSYNFMRDFYKEINSDTELFLSEPIEFLSEYRCFVHKGVLKGIQWYAGDFTIFPNISFIYQMIEDYKFSPISYTLDVGICEKNIDINLKKHITVLVEINDMLGNTGSYGFNAKDYVRMTIDRFQEIYKKTINFS
jgi:hypothetical protein